MYRIILWPSMCALTMTASAQPSGGTLEQLLTQMDGARLAEREAAERSLAAIPGLSLAQIETLARGEGLSPEQVFRLRQAGRRLFELKPMAGMGVQFEGFSNAGVIIGQTIEGFHAHEVLEPFDTIVICNNERMRTQDDLRWSILSRDPGETLTLEIRRGVQTLHVDVRLGGFDELPNAQRPTRSDYANAFAARWKRAVDDPIERMAPIGGETTVEEWARIEAGEMGEEGRPQWPLTRDAAPRMVAFGGRPRSALSIRQALADFSGPMISGDPAREEVSAVAEIVDQMRALSRQRIVVDQRAQTLERHADMVADPARQEQLVEMRNAALQEIINLDAELAALREALRVIREQGRE